MQTPTTEGPWWAVVTVWAVVNAVNVLQTGGFISRVLVGSRAVNRALGYAMMVLVAPAFAGMVAFVRIGAGWLQWTGPAVYLAFILLMVAVEYVWPVEFRVPPRRLILVPYLALFFGSILLMGVPMFSIDRGLWLVTVATTILLLSSMGMAMRKGEG